MSVKLAIHLVNILNYKVLTLLITYLGAKRGIEEQRITRGCETQLLLRYYTASGINKKAHIDYKLLLTLESGEIRCTKLYST